jgi:hypothetical protein
LSEEFAPMASSPKEHTCLAVMVLLLCVIPGIGLGIAILASRKSAQGTNINTCAMIACVFAALATALASLIALMYVGLYFCFQALETWQPPS